MRSLNNHKRETFILSHARHAVFSSYCITLGSSEKFTIYINGFIHARIFITTLYLNNSNQVILHHAKHLMFDCANYSCTQLKSIKNFFSIYIRLNRRTLQPLVLLNQQMTTKVSNGFVFPDSKIAYICCLFIKLVISIYFKYVVKNPLYTIIYTSE